jgi:hypothetical protein
MSTTFGGIEVSEAIGKVQAAISDAQAQLGEGAFKLGLESIELSLAVAWEITGEEKFKINVPFLGEIGPGAKQTQDRTTTIDLTLVPDQTEDLVGNFDLQTVLANAIVAAGNVAMAATANGMRADKAAVTIEFGFTAEGKIEVLVGSAGGKRSTTSTLKVNFAKA